MKTFEELGLDNEVRGTFQKLGIKTPSEIQEKAIPLVLAGRDVIGGSATGSGKTLVFATGIAENLKRNGKVQALVLTPTRELAEQVANSISKFSRYKKLNVLPVYGGVNMSMQIRKIQNSDVIVGTPGRILDHLQRKTLNLDNVRFLVLDEVDRMFDMGFQPDVERILGQCSSKRQTMLFSATVSSDVDYLAQKYTKNPARVSVKSHIDSSQLRQIYYDVPDQKKFSLFVHLLKKEKSKLVMVFCATRKNVEFVSRNLNNLGVNAIAIHGGLNQNRRNKVISEFNGNGNMNFLVCTDVAARGLDIKGVSHVYNYDLPKTSEEYIHRIGRTARAGRDGIAISILCSRDYENFSNIQRDEKLHIEEVKLPYFERVRIIVGERGRSSHGKNFGGRSSGRENGAHGRNRNDSGREGRGSKKDYGRGRRSDRKKPGAKRGRGISRKPVNRNSRRSFR